MQVHAGDPRDQPVGDSRGQGAQQKAVFSRAAPAADDVEAVVEGFQQAGNIGGIVLQIGVERDDDGAPSLVKAGGKRCRLPVVPRKAQDLYLAALLRRLPQLRKRAVDAAVVDANDLEIDSQSADCGPQLVEEGLDVSLLVEERNHDAQSGCLGVGCRHAGLDLFRPFWPGSRLFHDLTDNTSETMRRHDSLNPCTNCMQDIELP